MRKNNLLSTINGYRNQVELLFGIYLYYTYGTLVNESVRINTFKF